MATECVQRKVTTPDKFYLRTQIYKFCNRGFKFLCPLIRLLFQNIIFKKICTYEKRKYFVLVKIFNFEVLFYSKH